MFDANMRCKCTLLKVAEGHWIKPKSGYLDPDPDCRNCGGKGSKPTKVLFGDDAAEVWIGVCPICGESNGVYFEYPDLDVGPPGDGDRAPCLNDECPNEFCSWVWERDIEE